MKAKRKIGIIGKIALALLLVIVLFVAYLGFVLVFTQVYEPKTADSISGNGYVTASGRCLYDGEGNKLQLCGTNTGAWLVAEGWLTTYSIGAKYNADGSLQKDGGGNIQYEETPQEDFLAAIYSNPNLTTAQADELLTLYRDTWWQEEDFARVREIGMNCIRLPFYYLDVMEGEDDALVMREDAFEVFDWFLENCKKYELYCILDLHGAVGSQNMHEHSGSIKKLEFYDNDLYQQEMAFMWQQIALHYKNDRPDLSPYIAAYDVLNEPEDNGMKGASSSGKNEWDAMDVLYKAIREVDTEHVISIEGCWDFFALPNPARYGWENVMYQYHWYNWTNFPKWFFLLYKDVTLPFCDHNVPTLIGEFNFFDSDENWQEEWHEYLDLFKKRNYSWTTWSYKAAVTGDWTSSWGLYNLKMNLNTETEEQKVNVATATYDEIYAEFSRVGTSDSRVVKSRLCPVIEDYLKNN